MAIKKVRYFHLLVINSKISVLPLKIDNSGHHDFAFSFIHVGYLNLVHNVYVMRREM